MASGKVATASAPSSTLENVIEALGTRLFLSARTLSHKRVGVSPTKETESCISVWEPSF